MSKNNYRPLLSKRSANNLVEYLCGESYNRYGDDIHIHMDHEEFFFLYYYIRADNNICEQWSLRFAVWHGLLPIVREILADLSVVPKLYFIIHLTVISGHFEIVKLLTARPEFVVDEDEITVCLGFVYELKNSFSFGFEPTKIFNHLVSLSSRTYSKCLMDAISYANE